MKPIIPNPLKVAFALAVLLTSGCATDIPRTIRQAPQGDPAVFAVVSDPSPYLGQPVRWGGKIVAVNNLQQGSEMVVLTYPLNRWGQPRPEGESAGRFIGITEAFIDPAEYPEGRLVTLYGALERIEERMVGAFPYAYPLIRIHEKHLWPEEVNRSAWNWGPHDRWMHREPVIIIQQPRSE